MARKRLNFYRKEIFIQVSILSLKFRFCDLSQSELVSGERGSTSLPLCKEPFHLITHIYILITRFQLSKMFT